MASLISLKQGTAKANGKAPFRKALHHLAEGTQAGVGAQSAMRGIAVQNQKRINDDYHQRVRESHVAGLKAAGLSQDEINKMTGDSDMPGDVNIGDSYSIHNSNGGAAKTIAAVLGAALIGISGFGLARYLDRPEPDPAPAVEDDQPAPDPTPAPAPTPKDTNTQIGISVG